ncbi:MAG: RNA polymerase sporulation sigma factor SigH, partial [Clostridia bacterium]|nr:RNA polymerase sporulation sigma factor SigH [Clostridia bacterium]
TTEQRINDVLSSFEKCVLDLYINGKSYHDIAEILNKKSKSIDNAIQRIKKKITKCMEEARKEEINHESNS